MARGRRVPIRPEDLEDAREPRGLEPDADSESVEQLVEEGQALEAGVIAGVEKAADGEAQVRPRERPEDDVPPEYRDRD